MRRRELVAGLGAAFAANRPAGVWGQEAGRPFRIGVLMDLSEGDSEAQARLNAFREALTLPASLVVRWAGGDLAQMRAYAAELVALAPNVILSSSSPALEALDAVTQSIQIVFVVVADPVGRGYVANMRRPGGNKTGFVSWDLDMAEKWVELLKLAAPRLTSVMALHGPYRGFEAIEQSGARLGARVLAREVRDSHDIERALADLAQLAEAGIAVAPSPITIAHRGLILGHCERARVPAMYPYRFFAAEGGLMAYGIDALDLYRRAADYVARILQGEQAGDLPVQKPAKFHFVINLISARKLGLDLPASFVARADEVIE